MDLLRLLRILRDRNAPPLRETRTLFDRSNPLQSLSDTDFRRHYRLSKRGVLQLTGLLDDDLKFGSDRGSPLTPLQQVCLTLAYVGGGTFQHTAGLIGGVSKSCANITIHRVTEAICRISPDYIKMPTRTEMRESAQFFYSRFGLPNFALGVDGTHIRLSVKPTEAELPAGVRPQDFWCRKQFYSVNVQIVGNEKKLINNIIARWSGSTHDSRVWRNSRVRQILEAQNEFLIAGDSAYPISRILMKPYPQTNDRTERRFNAKLSGLRTICTENVIGLWKQRFTCLRKGLGTKLNLTVDIIVACAVLHNLAIFWQEPEPEEEADEGGEDENYDQNDDGRAEMNRLEVRAAGQAHRDWLCQNYC